MKINEIIDEAPSSRVANFTRGLGSRMLNRIGAKGTAKKIAGKADAAATANNLFNKFVKTYLKPLGKKAKDVQGEDVKGFFDKIGYKTQIQVPQGPLDKKSLNAIFSRAGEERTAGALPSTDYSEPKPKIRFKPNQPVMFVSKKGKLISATVVGKSQDGDDSKVNINSGKQNYNISREKLLDPKTQKPFKT